MLKDLKVSEKTTNFAPEIKLKATKNMKQTEKKSQVSPDFLYERLKEHNMTISMVARKMGLSESIVRNSFRHNLNRHGKPMSFTSLTLPKLNEALELIARELRESIITFGSDQTFTNQRGTTYDPGTLPAIQKIGEYFKLKGLTKKALGWEKTKCETTLSVKSSPMYGRVTRDDVARINAEVLAVAGELAGYEVVTDCDDAKPAERQTVTKDKCTRTRMEQSFEPPKYEWDDTSLGLPERSALLRKQWPNGMLLFRVDGGYTTEGDDARTVHEMLPDVHLYTNPESGMITAWMSKEKMEQVLPQFISQGRRVIITDMYKE